MGGDAARTADVEHRIYRFGRSAPSCPRSCGGTPHPNLPPQGGKGIVLYGTGSAIATQVASWLRIGRVRMRLPVALKMALVRAGAIGGTPGSPTPPSGRL